MSAVILPGERFFRLNVMDRSHVTNVAFVIFTHDTDVNIICSTQFTITQAVINALHTVKFKTSSTQLSFKLAGRM